MIVLKIVAIILLIFIICVLFTWICTLFIDKNKIYTEDSKFFRGLLNLWTSFALKIMGIRVKIEGLEKIPKGRFLLVQNHRSNFDPIITWYLLRKSPISFISKKENFNIPLFGRIIHRCCFRTIDRENPRNALKTILDSSELITNDKVSIGVYPEGTRNKHSDENLLLPFHNGVFKIAQKANVPIVVTTIAGTEQITKNYPFSGTDIVFKVVDVIPSDEIASERTEQIGIRVKHCMTEGLKPQAKKEIKSDLQTRIATGAVITVLCVLALWFSYNYIHLKAILAVICICAEFELFRTYTSKRKKTIGIVISWIYSWIMLGIPTGNYPIFFFSSYILCIVCVLVFIWNFKFFKNKSIGFQVAIGLMLPIFIRAIIDIRYYTNGLLFLVLTILITSITDVFAYLIGQKYGKRKIAPLISPNKTLEGAIGGNVVSLIISFIFVCLFMKPSGVMECFIWSIFIATASFLGQIGDLLMSGVKRITDIKDFGRILPGHGGILDRMDSFLLVVPYALLWLPVLIRK